MNFINNEHRNIYLIILTLTVLATIVLYSDRHTASNLVIVPDSTEYTLAAHRFATTGEYKILVDGRWLPPRYPPWFSVLVLAPAYLLLGIEPGNAIYSITFFGVVGVLLAFFLGKKIGGNWGGVFASLILLALPIYRIYSKFIMTDVPATALILIVCLIYLWLKTGTNTRPSIFLLPGLFIAVAALFRPTCASTVLPFLVYLVHSNNLNLTIRKLIFLIAPLAIAATASVVYNTYIFGYPFRNGYHFWSSVPYDYINLSYSLSYVHVNLILLWKSKIIHFAAMVFAVWASNNWIIDNKNNSQSSLRSIHYFIEFILLGTGPIILFHMIYYYPEPRFYLPTISLAAIITGGIIGSWSRKFPFLTILTIFGMLVISQFFTTIEAFNKSKHLLNRRSAANEIIRLTPENSFIISTIEPAYIEYLTARESQRRIVPLSRNVEYADKLIAPKKIAFPSPPPLNWGDNRCAGLVNGGAQEAVHFVASEQLDNIAQQIASNTKVFLNTTNIKQQDLSVLNEFKKRFIFIKFSKDLFELQNQN